MKLKQKIIGLTENWPAKIISLTAALVLSYFYRGSLIDTRYIVAPLVLENNGFLVPKETYPQKIKIMLRGDANSIASIRDEDITAFIDISHLKSRGTYRIPIQTRMNGTAVATTPLEVTPKPLTLLLQLEEGMTKSVPVILSLRGITADGYEVAESFIDTPTAEIRGPVSIINKIDNLTTEPLSIESRTNGFSGSTNILKTNDLITLLGKTQVQYTVKINEIIAKKSINNIPIVFENLNPNFTLSTPQTLGSIKLEGPKKQLDAWVIPQKLLTAACGTINEPGTYTVPIVPNLSAKNTKIHITHFTPKSVQIKVLLNEKNDSKETSDNDNRHRH
ncbi:MAG: CdaR family protein [Treponema sp.]